MHVKHIFVQEVVSYNYRLNIIYQYLGFSFFALDSFGYIFGDILKEMVNPYYIFGFSNKQEKPMQHFISYCFIENDQFH